MDLSQHDIDADSNHNLDLSQHDLDLSQHNIDSQQQKDIISTEPVGIIQNQELKDADDNILSESPVGVDDIDLLDTIDKYQRERSCGKKNLSEDSDLDSSIHSHFSATEDKSVRNYEHFPNDAIEVELKNKNVMEDYIKVSFYGSSNKGMSAHDTLKPNQDSFFVQHCQKTDSLILACMDGHGSTGHFVSQFCKFYLKAHLHKHPDFDKDVKKAIKEVFAELDVALRNDALVATLFSGTTLVLAVIRNNEITVANIGDSKAILGYRIKLTTDPDDSNYAFLVQPLSITHKPDSPDERARITTSGGRVMVAVDYLGIPCGPARVYLKRENLPGLAMSRSLGDDAVHDVGVSSEPTFETFNLKDAWSNSIKASNEVNAPRFALFVATDGLFDVMNNVDIIKVAYESKYDPYKTVELLQQKSQAQWFKTFGLADDTTIICATI